MCEKPLGLAVRVMIHDEDGRILLLKRSLASKTNPGRWEFPGGKVDHGEAFDKALIREVYEETGLKVSLRHPIGIAEQELPHVRAVHLIVTGKMKGGKLILSREHEDYTWASIKGMEKLELADWLERSLNSIIELYCRKLGENHVF